MRIDPVLHAATVDQAPVTLATWTTGCAWRTAAEARLDAAGRSPRVRLTSCGRGDDVPDQLRLAGRRGPRAEDRHHCERGRGSLAKHAAPRSPNRASPRVLRTSCQSEADLLFRQRAQIVERRLLKSAIGDAKTPLGRQRRLARFGATYTPKWRARTFCAEPYRSRVRQRRAVTV